MFGGQKTPFGTSSTFGGTPSFGSTFGQPAAQAGATSLFGAKPSVSFGTTTTAMPTGSLFGTPANAFGTTGTVGGTSGGLFGGTSTFNTPTAGTLFGGPSTQTKPLFGASTTTPFGATATSQSTGFTFGTGTTGGGLFGAQPQTSTATGLFGATAQPAAPSGGLFGTSMIAAPTGTTIKFNPKLDTDTMLKNNMQQNIQTKHQCITAMKEYESKSLEELRVDDYLANRKGSAMGAQSGFTFGASQPQQQTTGLFGATASTAGSIFAQPNKPLFAGNTFGTATSSAPGTSLFGQPAQQQQTGLFGATANKPLFGATTTTTSSFTFSTPATSSLFGQPQAQQSLFGAQTTQPSLFGATQQQQPAAPLFGTQNTGLAFGQPQQQQQQQGQSIFGATTGFAPAGSAFGAFGQQTSTAPFGAGTGLFGAKTTTSAAPAFGGFGTATTFGAGTGFGGFGATSQPSVFGAAQQQQKPLFSGFGTQQPSFGAGTAPTAGTGLFGTSTFGAAGGQSLFGGQQQAKPTLNFGTTGFGTTNLGFGAAAVADASQTFSLGTNDAAALMQQEILKSQLIGLSTSPYGDRKPLFGNKVGESSALPVPTDPITQKRIMDSTKATVFGSNLQPQKPLPPFKPATRLIVGSPSFGKQTELPPPLQGIDSDTISFTEGFIPKKNIKKLIIKPKDTNGMRTGTNLNVTNSGGHRGVSFPEGRALTTAVGSADGGGRVDRSAVQALNFDNTAYCQESDGRSIVSPSSSVLRGSSFVSDNAGSPSDRQEKTNLVSNTPASTSGTATSAASTTTPPIHASPSTVSSSSQTPASPDENQLQSDHPAGIILTRSEYYTIPSLKELEKLVDRSTGDCVVNGFTVGRTGYGSIFWPGETNVAGLNLDELVHFRHKEVTVYPDDEKRPLYGADLNKKAEITLERVWPMDKTTRASIKDPKRLELMKYREKLEKATIQMEADFVDYRPDTGSWVFMVPHFSKYGLADEADEDQPSLMELETSQQELPVQAKDKFSVQRSVVDVGFSLDAGSKGLGGEDQYRLFTDEDELLTDVEFDGDMGRTSLTASYAFGGTGLYKTAPLTSGLFSDFFREIRQSEKFSSLGKEVGGIFDELDDISTGRRVKRKTIFSELQDKSLALLRKTEDDHSSIIDLSQQQQPEVVPSPASSFIGARCDAIFLTRPRHEIRLVPYEQSVTFKRSHDCLDAGLFNGRRFRLGWSPMGVMMTMGQADDEGDVSQPTSLFGVGRILGGPKEFSITLARAIPEIYPTILTDLDALLQCQSELSEFELSGEQTRLQQLIPVEDTVKMLELYEETAIQLKDPQLTSAIVRLCDALWGKIDKEQTRGEFLSQWIIEQSRPLVDETVDELKQKGNEFYAEAVYCLLTSRRIEEAAQLAQESGDWRLSLTVCQMVESGMEVKALYLQQLTRWMEVQADKFINKTRLKIFMLAAGILNWKTSDGRRICAYEDLDWKRTFGLHLWYACAPFPSIPRALEHYDSAWRTADRSDGYERATQPLTSYAEADPDLSQKCRYWSAESATKLDVCYHLLRLYTDRSHSIYTVLEPSTWTPDLFDFHLSWHLWCILRSLGLVVVERGRLDTLHAQYAFQLERKGLWQRGVFVALHMDDPCRREALIKQLLAQQGRKSAENDSMARKRIENDAAVLVNMFNIPENWVLEVMKP